MNTVLDEKALLPCPFCGGKAEFWHVRPSAPALRAWIACVECHSIMTREYDTDEQAIAAWNRPSPSQGDGPAADVVREIWDAATNAVCQTMQDRGVCNCRDGHCVAAKIEPAQQDIEYFAALASLAPRGEGGAEDRDGDGPYVTDAARYPG